MVIFSSMECTTVVVLCDHNPAVLQHFRGWSSVAVGHTADVGPAATIYILKPAQRQMYAQKFDPLSPIWRLDRSALHHTRQRKAPKIRLGALWWRHKIRPLEQLHRRQSILTSVSAAAHLPSAQYGQVCAC